MYFNKIMNLLPCFEEDAGGASGAMESESSQPDDGNFNLFDDDDGAGEPLADSGSDTDDPEAKPEAGKPGKSQEPNPEAKPETFRFKHMKQEVELTRDQVIDAAQKGLNYDRLRESHDRLYGSVESAAKAANVTVDQFLENLQTLVVQTAIDGKKQAFMAQGIDENISQLLAQMAYENETLKGNAANERQRRQAAQQQASNRNTIIQHDIDVFEAMYPDVKELPTEVVSKIRDGKAPVVAYQNYLSRVNEKKTKADAQNVKNQAVAAGPVKGTEGNKPDTFLAEFMKA